MRKKICVASPTKLVRFALVAGILTLVWVASLYLAEFVATNGMAQNLVADFGYLGILTIAVISGVNVLLPVPAATFVPIFTAAGLSLPVVILMLVIGTTIADYIGYFLGRWSRDFAIAHYPNTYRRVLSINEHHHSLIIPFVFVYAALIPFPNEAIIIPLALVGMRFKTLLLPLVLGNIINQTALALGASNIFQLLF